MEIYRSLSDVRADSRNVLTIGTFDGVHRGHQFVVAELLKYAGALGGIPTLVTFEPHPQVFLRRRAEPVFLLSTKDEKIDSLARLGIQKLIIIPFTRSFSQLTAETYIRDILFGRIGCKGVVVGYDHAFGRDRQGGMLALRTVSAELNFEVIQLQKYQLNGESISSSKIRAKLQAGAVAAANDMLGRLYAVPGKVVRGDGRGHGLGFPTANIALVDENKLLPANGVYIVEVKLGSRMFKGMANIGLRPTFDGRERLLEAHIFDFSGEIYNEKIEIFFHQKIRDEAKFRNLDELVQQLKNDRISSLAFFENS